MKREDRAKQFLPFDAMKGLYEALRRQEELLERVEKVEVGEEDAAAISAVLSRISRGDSVSVTFYRAGHYLTLSGTVTAFDEVKRLLVLSDEKLPFDDIVAVELSSNKIIFA